MKHSALLWNVFGRGLLWTVYAWGGSHIIMLLYAGQFYGVGVAISSLLYSPLLGLISGAVAASVTWVYIKKRPPNAYYSFVMSLAGLITFVVGDCIFHFLNPSDIPVTRSALTMPVNLVIWPISAALGWFTNRRISTWSQKFVYSAT